MHKSVGTCELHSSVLRELSEVVAKPLSIVFEKLRQSSKVSSDWENRNITPIFKKSKKGRLAARLSSVSGKIIIEKIFLEDMSRHMDDRAVIRESQHGFTKSK